MVVVAETNVLADDRTIDRDRTSDGRMHGVMIIIFVVSLDDNEHEKRLRRRSTDAPSLYVRVGQYHSRA